MQKKEDEGAIDMKMLGMRIKEVRTEAGETMEEFGKKIGLSASTVYKWEAGLVSVKESSLQTICSLYNVSEDWLKGKDSPKIPETADHKNTRELLNHSMMFLSDNELLKTELFITSILEKPLHAGIVRGDAREKELLI